MITWQRKHFNGEMRNFIFMCLVTFYMEFTAIDRELVTAEIFFRLDPLASFSKLSLDK